MTIDLVLLCLIGVFALVGAATGAAKQIANLVALALAYICARPVGTFLGPLLAKEFKIPDSIGIVAATFIVFLTVLILGRVLLTQLLQRVLAGRESDSRLLDGALGFVLGGMKVVLIAWVVLCALTFVEENVTWAGKKLGVTPKTSRAFALAREYNLFEWSQFAPVKDLIHVAQAMTNPEQARKLKSDPAFQRLQADPRFKDAMDRHGLDPAFASGDYRTLLKHPSVMKLIQDPKAAEQLRSAAAKVE